MDTSTPHIQPTTRTAPGRSALFHLAHAVVGIGLIGLAACGGTSSRDAAPATTPTTTAAVPPPTTTAPTTTASPATTAPVTVTPSTEAMPTPRPTDTVDEHVGPEGAQVHIRCSGEGAATVVLMSGFQASSASWAAVDPALSQRTRVCTYDRPGTGASEPPSSTQTFATEARDLYELLADVGEPGPYVVVGHSFGGAEAVTFASQFRDEVSGLVLVDASPTTWPAAMCGVADDGTAAAQTVIGVCRSLSDPNDNSERLDVFTAFDETATITTVGSLPITVITAVDREMPAGLAADVLAHLTDVWDQGQQHWQQLSTNSREVSVPNTSHDIQLDHPDLVIDEIVRLLP